MLSPSKVSIADKRVPQGFPDAVRIAQSRGMICILAAMPPQL
jgi:hypothetical protein